MNRLVVVAIIAIVTSGCANERGSLIGPSLPIVPSAPAPVPAPMPKVPDAVLFGVVSAMSASGRVPLSGVELEVGVCPNGAFGAASFARVMTGLDGSYRVPGMCAGETYFWVSKHGYTTAENPRPCDGGCLYVVIEGDTRVDIELVKL